MRTIWKIPLKATDKQTIEVPRGGKFLHTDVNDEELCLWFEVLTESPKVEKEIWVFGTGNPIPDDLHISYRGTVIVGSFAWHIYEEF